jgi:hypothetical protein
MYGIEGLDGILEYNNAGALLGLDGAEDMELMGALRRISPVKRQMIVNKLAHPGALSRGSRAEMEKHFSELPAHIKQALVAQELRLADTIIYSIKPVSSKTIKMFETQDDKEVGLRNISNAKLPKNQAFLVSGIFMLAGVAADASKDAIMAAEYKGLEGFNAIANGEFDLKSNKKQIVPETANSIFKTANLHSAPLGYYKLSNPRIITDDVLIEFTINLGTTSGIAANTQLYIGLHGTITTP